MKPAQQRVAPRLRDRRSRRDILGKARHVAGREGKSAVATIAPYCLPDRSLGGDVQRIGDGLLDPTRDLPLSRKGAADTGVSRQRKGPEAFRRQKRDIDAEPSAAGGKRLQSPD